MPRRAKGPRLYLKQRAGREAVWIIRDGTVEVSTGCGAGEQPAAERELGLYIAKKFTAPTLKADSRRDPAQVLAAEVVALYSQDKAATSGLDAATFDRFVANLLAFWAAPSADHWKGEAAATLADVKRSTCKAYAAHRQAMPDARYKDPTTAPRVSSETARRELEMLSGAIGYWHGEDTLTTRPVMWLPEKPESPRDALTRSQAASLLRAALGSRKGADGRWRRLSGSARANRAHMRRFILIGFYTGTRPGVIPKVLWKESATQAWADLDKGVIWRRGKQERDHKTKRRPMVKLHPRLLAHMRRWKAMDERLMQERAAKNLPTCNTIIHHGGHPLAGKERKGYAGCVSDAGLPEEVTPHWQRHSAATWLMEGGCDPWMAAGYLGMTIETLEKHYGHHRPDHQAEAIRAIGGRR